MELKTYVVAICDDEADLKVEIIKEENWKKAVLAHEHNPFTTDPEEGEPEPDPEMIPDGYDDAVQEAFNMDCDLAVHELRVESDLSVKLLDVE